MSLEQLKTFLSKVKGDSNLQEQINTAKSSKDVLAIAKEYGHDFNADHCSELTKSDLEAISGGNKDLEKILGKAGCMPWNGS
ncbi:nif11-like leader peptide domain protein [Synechococcus sp. BIOS-E4-1]|uniref:Nif11-like leader peptide family natural product precursor n=1 Tax=Synechococcus sp. BIOS-E4-1 TaxID=1400864 RepID=UPI001647CCF5|nr:Nif11-like leader peptide family natural product precursor [Synechococcus sp. BIOS-E4-1]QNI56273.1 nif11-like leader peptide domain protein [Synechococcus sp. BIOS-E4-1]